MSTEQTSLEDRLHHCEAALKAETARRKNAETALQNARERFRKALLDLPVIICAADRDGSLVFYNREFERVSGYSAEDLHDLPGMLEILLREDEGPCIAAKSEADFTHGVCPDCMTKLYPSDDSPS